MLCGCGPESIERSTATLQCHTSITLKGTIEQKTFPGPPNYDDITKNPENYWILKLRDPVDVAKDPDSPAPDESQPQKDVREIQLVTDYGKYRQFLGREVVVTGSLWQGFTVHHKTAVLMDVEEIHL